MYFRATYAAVQSPDAVSGQGTYLELTRVLSAVHPLSMTASQLVSWCCYGQTDCASEGVRVVDHSNRAKAIGYDQEKLPDENVQRQYSGYVSN